MTPIEVLRKLLPQVGKFIATIINIPCAIALGTLVLVFYLLLKTSPAYGQSATYHLTSDPLDPRAEWAVVTIDGVTLNCDQATSPCIQNGVLWVDVTQYVTQPPRKFDVEVNVCRAVPAPVNASCSTRTAGSFDFAAPDPASGLGIVSS